MQQEVWDYDNFVITDNTYQNSTDMIYHKAYSLVHSFFSFLSQKWLVLPLYIACFILFMVFIKTYVPRGKLRQIKFLCNFLVAGTYIGFIGGLWFRHDNFFPENEMRNIENIIMMHLFSVGIVVATLISIKRTSSKLSVFITALFGKCLALIALIHSLSILPDAKIQLFFLIFSMFLFIQVSFTLAILLIFRKKAKDYQKMMESSASILTDVTVV